jgi:hypothetical protein
MLTNDYYVDKNFEFSRPEDRCFVDLQDALDDAHRLSPISNIHIANGMYYGLKEKNHILTLYNHQTLIGSSGTEIAGFIPDTHNQTNRISSLIVICSSLMLSDYFDITFDNVLFDLRPRESNAILIRDSMITMLSCTLNVKAISLSKLSVLSSHRGDINLTGTTINILSENTNHITLIHLKDSTFLCRGLISHLRSKVEIKEETINMTIASGSSRNVTLINTEIYLHSPSGVLNLTTLSSFTYVNCLTVIAFNGRWNLGEYSELLILGFMSNLIGAAGMGEQHTPFTNTETLNACIVFTQPCEKVIDKTNL